VPGGLVVGQPPNPHPETPTRAKYANRPDRPHPHEIVEVYDDKKCVGCGALLVSP
jgi:hypothetical protein